MEQLDAELTRTEEHARELASVESGRLECELRDTRAELDAIEIRLAGKLAELQTLQDAHAKLQSECSNDSNWLHATQSATVAKLEAKLRACAAALNGTRKASLL